MRVSPPPPTTPHNTLGRHLTLTVPLSTKAYGWVPANLMLRVTLCGLESHAGGSRNSPSPGPQQELFCILATRANTRQNRGGRAREGIHLALPPTVCEIFVLSPIYAQPECFLLENACYAG